MTLHTSSSDDLVTLCHKAKRDVVLIMVVAFIIHCILAACCRSGGIA